MVKMTAKLTDLKSLKRQIGCKWRGVRINVLPVRDYLVYLVSLWPTRSQRSILRLCIEVSSFRDMEILC
jgi:hypothetical protein